MLEPYEGKPSRTVLRRESGSNPADLAGSWGPQPQRRRRKIRCRWIRGSRSDLQTTAHQQRRWSTTRCGSNCARAGTCSGRDTADGVTEYVKGRSRRGTALALVPRCAPQQGPCVPSGPTERHPCPSQLTRRPARLCGGGGKTGVPKLCR